jgi:hypothetical protein
MLVRGGLILWIALTLGACATARQPDEQSAPTPASASAPNEQAESSIVKQDGCTVDLKQICQAFIDQPEFVINGERYSWERFTNSAAPHAEFELPASVLGPGAEGSARCQVTIHTRKVTGARMLSGGPSIAKTMAYFKQGGWCEEASPNYDQLMADEMQKLGNNL